MQYQPLFWEEEYKGRHIAIYSQFGVFYVYIDRKLLPGITFNAGATAKEWLRHSIDLQEKKKIQQKHIPKELNDVRR